MKLNSFEQSILYMLRDGGELAWDGEARTGTLTHLRDTFQIPATTLSDLSGRGLIARDNGVWRATNHVEQEGTS